MTVEERLERLERQNRRMRKGFVALAAVLIGVVLMGQAAPNEIPNVIRAKKFEVVNGRGQTMVELGSIRPYGYVFVSNREGKVVVSMSANHVGNGLIQTTDNQGRPLIMITSKLNNEGAIITLRRGEELDK